MGKEAKKEKRIAILAIIVGCALLLALAALGVRGGWFNERKIVLEEEYLGEFTDYMSISAEDYEKAAAMVPANENALHKIEAEDGDDVYYIEESNEFVVVSTDGYIRTYFEPNSGKKYFDRQ